MIQPLCGKEIPPPTGFVLPFNLLLLPLANFLGDQFTQTYLVFIRYNIAKMRCCRVCVEINLCWTPPADGYKFCFTVENKTLCHGFTNSFVRLHSQLWSCSKRKMFHGTQVKIKCQRLDRNSTHKMFHMLQPIPTIMESFWQYLCWCAKLTRKSWIRPNKVRLVIQWRADRAPCFSAASHVS